MHIQTINYTRTFNLGNSNFEKIGVEFFLNQGDCEKKALDAAKELVEEYHKQNVESLKNDEFTIGVIPSESKQTLAERTIQCINDCKTKEELKAWELMAKSNPEILESYNAKLKTL